MLSEEELRSFLDEKFMQFNTLEFIPDDPITIPHSYSNKEDIEIAGFLAATIAWGQRKTIINNAQQLMLGMDNAPAEFIRNHEDSDLLQFENFVHRTFNSVDLIQFMKALKRIYNELGGLEKVFAKPLSKKDSTIEKGLVHFRNVFFDQPHERRTEKHVASPETGSACKRLNMFLRWMVRQDEGGVDFGLWKSISPAQLLLPLDVHTANVSSKLGLLSRKQRDWKAVLEVTSSLRQLDPEDPVKYDFALFGLGIYEDF